MADSESVKETIVETGGIPKCSKCNGNVKPDIVFFGESLPERFYGLLKKDVEKADLMLILGTSLQVSIGGDGGIPTASVLVICY